MLLHSIPDDLIINADQTPSKFVSTDNITLAAKGQRRISRAGSNDKRSITLTVFESFDGQILPLQIMYKGKIQRCSQPSISPMVLVYRTVKKHRSNEKETIPLTEEVLVPYIKKFKE